VFPRQEKEKWGERKMQFKAEIALLMVTISLFAVSAFLYTYQVTTAAANSFALGDAFNAAAYPYRGFALSFVAAGSALMVAASISYMKRSKSLLEKTV
jgi:hypothetical protein